ncbi:uncharacterized protein BDV14DRAFT_195388 [Aspergillus stella-maris]|uniref:uncharacterized protein n=1 Tax=Aspergillus stella-maris TaxID=1810926 RepID=UPI003CCDBE81
MQPPTITVAPYSHDIYHAITKPSLHEAMSAFHRASAMEAVNTAIRNCFLKHNVQNKFTACINHRHFDLDPSERNIEESDGRAMASSDFEGIVPCSWLFHEGKLYPYEYRRVEKDERGEVDPNLPQAFIDELGAILAERRISDVIGIQSYNAGIVGMESTDRPTRTSTTKSYAEGSEEGIEATRKNAVVASFAFF